jgi:hypothetical protein
MPSLHGVAHDRCVHLLYNSSWKFYQLAAGQLLSGQPVRYGTTKAGGMARPSYIHTKPHLLGHSLPASHAGRRVGVLCQPSSLRPHWIYTIRESVRSWV